MSESAPLAPGAQLAQQARQRFVADISSAMAELATRVQERLTALLDEAAPAHQRQHRRDLWTLYQSRRKAWLEGTIKDWQRALQPPPLVPQKSGEGGFELLGTEVVENKIVASRLVLSVMEGVSSELNDLRVRIKRLEARADLENHDIFRPELLLLLMIEQWAVVGMPRDAWPLVNELALKLLAERLNHAYLNANKFLIEHGVLPVIALEDRVKRVVAAPPRIGVSKLGTAAQTSTAGSASSTGVLSKAPTGDAREQADILTAAAPSTHASTTTQNVMGQIRRLLGRADGAGFQATQYQAPSPALASALAQRDTRPGNDSGDDRGTGASSSVDVGRAAIELRRSTTNLKNMATTPVEKATIEIVALMFQAILQEDRIPPGIRVWFARLQMPVLREALTDPEFLDTSDHPARQLIDRMGSCAMGFDASGVSASALEAEIRRGVQVIEQYPETGKLVYQVVYDDFQKFLAQFLSGKESTQRVVSVAQQIEEKETLTIQYTIELRNMLKHLPVRTEIREFLFKVWAEVLALAALRNGPQHAQTLVLKKAATDLIWAASAKPERSDRARVIADLPQLLQTLRAGMTLLGLAPSDQQNHIKNVSDTLADAFLSKTQAIATEKIAAMAERLAHLEDFVSDDGTGDLPLDAEGIKAMLGLDAASIDVISDGGSKPTAAMLARVQGLQLGAWFTLDHNAQVDQVQLVWRSVRKHLHLLAASDGHSYLMQTRRLAAYLQAGLLLPLEEETLTVRASRNALGKLEANPERLLH
jgi:hypothetical protein